ncbi:unnamed protein product, partial [Ectocarpus fasciculatus]
MDERKKVRIRVQTLSYFRRELNDNKMQLESEVFRTPDHKKLVSLNKLAVKVFLSQNWSFIKKEFPRLPDFVHVFADADIMYTANYPFHHVKTGDLHGVETVMDFFDFAWRLVEKTHTRLNKTSEPVVSDDLSAVKLGKLLLPGVTVAQEVFRPGEKKMLMDADNPITRVQKMGTDAQKKLRLRYPQLSVEVDKNKPQLPEYHKGLRVINQLDQGDVLSDAVVFSILQDILKAHGLTIHAKIYDGTATPFEFMFAFNGDMKMEYTEQEITAINVVMNDVIMNVKKDKNLQSVVGWVTQNTIEKFPVDVALRGEVQSDSSFITESIVYVAGDRIVLKDIDDVRTLVRPDRGKILHTLIDTDVSVLAHGNYEGARYAVGSDPPKDNYSEESLNKAQEHAGKYVNLSKLPSPDEPSLNAQAHDLKNIFYGQEKTLLHNEPIMVIIFLSQQSTTENADLLYKVSEFVAQLAETRTRLGSIHTGENLSTLLKQLDTLHKVSEESLLNVKWGVCATNADSGECADPDTLEKLKHEVYIVLKQELQDPILTLIDEYMSQHVRAYNKWAEARDSRDPQMRLQAELAVASARAMGEDQQYPNVFLAKHGRKVQRGGHVRFPLGFGNIVLPLLWDVAELFTSTGKKAKFYDNFEKVLLGDRTAEVHGMSIKDLRDNCNDVSFAYAVQMPRNIEDWMLYDHEKTSALHVLMFLLVVACTQLLFYMFSTGDEEKTRYVKSGVNFILICIEITALVPMAAVHLLTYI